MPSSTDDGIGVLDFLSQAQEPARVRAFKGRTYQEGTDYHRLSNNLQRVYFILLDGKWHTEKDLRPVGGSQWLRRVRDLRGDNWGPLTVMAERIDGGSWRYLLDLNTVTDRIHGKIVNRNPDETNKAPKDALAVRRRNMIKALREIPEDVLEQVEAIVCPKVSDEFDTWAELLDEDEA